MAFSLISLSLVVSGLLGVPTLVYAVECMAGRVPSAAAMQRPAMAVLVPAHNEGHGIAATLRSIRAELRAGDRLVAVADNCENQTAEIARNASAEVIERRDSVLHRTKRLSPISIFITARKRSCLRLGTAATLISAITGLLKGCRPTEASKNVESIETGTGMGRGGLVASAIGSVG
jgi:hypothetical protein